MGTERVEEVGTALALFRKYQPQYRRIVLRPWKLDSANDRLSFVPVMSGLICLEPHFIDLRERRLGCQTSYDPDKPESMHDQFTASIWADVESLFLKNRHFYVDPDWTSRVQCANGKHIRLKISHDGDPIKGLYLEGRMLVHDWASIIPRESDAGKAIEAALVFDEAQATIKVGHPDVEKLRADLMLRISRVSLSPLASTPA